MNPLRMITGVVGLSMLVLMTGCAETKGGLVGAGAGAAIGAGTGYGAGKGALIGAGTGVAAGAIYDGVKHRGVTRGRERKRLSSLRARRGRR